MCLLETMLLVCCFFFPGIMFKKTNDKRTVGCKVCGCNVTIRSTKYTQQSASKGIYSHLLVSKGKERDVVRIYWYLSALCRFNGMHKSADIRIYPQ